MSTYDTDLLIAGGGPVVLLRRYTHAGKGFR
jgi:hypothetical protein